MNTLIQQALGAIIRWFLAWLSGYLVTAGIWKGEDAEKYVAAATLGILALGWSLWQKYKSRSKFLTALMLPPGSTENDVKAHIASGAATPTVTTPSDTSPEIPKPPTP